MRPPHVLLSVDPGKVNGVSIFRDGIVESISQVPLADFPTFLFDFARLYEDQEVVVVYENFKLFKGKALQQSGSHMEASQAVGQLKMIAVQNNWKVFDQAPNIKSIAEKWSKTKAPSDHSKSHQIDAYNHGIYFLVSRGMKRIEV